MKRGGGRCGLVCSTRAGLIGQLPLHGLTMAMNSAGTQLTAERRGHYT